MMDLINAFDKLERRECEHFSLDNLTELTKWFAWHVAILIKERSDISDEKIYCDICDDEMLDDVGSDIAVNGQLKKACLSCYQDMYFGL